MAGLSSVASKIPGAVAGELARKSLSGLGSSILSGLGTGGSLNFGSAESGADDAQESGKQTGPTGDKSKDVINALRDLQSDVNKQSAALKKNNGLLAKQTDILSKGFEALIKSNDKNTELLSQMSGGGSLGDLLKSAAPSILPSLASPAAVTAIAAIAASAAYELYKSGKEYLDIPNRPDFEKLKEKSAGLTEQEEINSAWTSRGKAMGGSTSLPSGAAGVGAGRGTPEFAEKPGQRASAIANLAVTSSAAPVSTTASRTWKPKQISSPTGSVSIGRTAGAPVGASGPINGNASEAMQFFMSKGWSKEQAAGIVGNLKIESGNFASDVLSGTRKGDGGKAIGVAQWHKDRRDIFQNLFGKSIIGSSFKEQLEFVNWELNNSEKKTAGDKLRLARTAQEAAVIVDKFYERSSGAHRTQRIAAALQYAGATADQINTAASPSGSSDAMQVASAETGTSGGGGGDYSADGKGGGGADNSPAGKAISSATSGGAALSSKESSTLKQAMAVSDPHVKSRAMFQAAQDAEARGENSTALFWAADKQRQAELANVGKQQATQQAGKTAAGSESIKPLKGKVYTDSVDINAPANEMPLGTWTARPGAAAEAALPAVGYDAEFLSKPPITDFSNWQNPPTEVENRPISAVLGQLSDQVSEKWDNLVDASRVAPGDIEDRTKALTNVGDRFRGRQVDMGREAIQKSQNTEPGYSGSSGQTLQNAVNTPAESSSDNSQSSIKPEDTSIGAQEFNRIFGNFYNATAGW